MLIEYFNKFIVTYNTNGMDFDLIEYEISEQDMVDLSEMLLTNVGYDVKRILLYKDKLCDLVVDNIPGKRVVVGGITETGKYMLNQYIVRKGLNKLLKRLESGDIF